MQRVLIHSAQALCYCSHKFHTLPNKTQPRAPTLYKQPHETLLSPPINLTTNTPIISLPPLPPPHIPLAKVRAHPRPLLKGTHPPMHVPTLRHHLRHLRPTIRQAYPARILRALMYLSHVTYVEHRRGPARVVAHYVGAVWAAGLVVGAWRKGGEGDVGAVLGVVVGHVRRWRVAMKGVSLM